MSRNVGNVRIVTKLALLAFVFRDGLLQARLALVRSDRIHSIDYRDLQELRCLQLIWNHNL